MRHLRAIFSAISVLTTADQSELYSHAKRLAAPIDLVQQTAASGRLPVPLFCAGGIATPADAALVRQLGAQAVFVGSGIFKSADPQATAAAIVQVTTHPDDADLVAQVSSGLGAAMRGLDPQSTTVHLADRGQ
jgi:pyridoxal 5'-phosphate synthase pdxS subunit